MKVRPIFIAWFKRKLPSVKYLLREHRDENSICKYIPNISDMIKEHHPWIQNKYQSYSIEQRSMITDDLGMTLQRFRKIMFGATHVTLFELIRIAEVLELDFNFSFQNIENE